MKTSLAKIISFIGHPLLTITLFVVIVLFSKSSIKTASFLSLLILGGIVTPLTAVMYFKSKNGTFTNFDVSDRKQRNKLFYIAIPLLTIVTIVVFITHQEKNICISLLFSSIITLVSWVVNLFIKSSLHVSLTMFIAFLAFLVYPPMGYIFIAIAFLLGWSRTVLKRHTLLEVIIGGIIGFSIGIIMFHFYHR